MYTAISAVQPKINCKLITNILTVFATDTHYLAYIKFRHCV